MGDGEDVDVEGYLRALGKKIRILRLTREWTQEDLGAATGMSRNFVRVKLGKKVHADLGLRVAEPGSSNSGIPSWGVK
jgi:hypothetical protein